MQRFIVRFDRQLVMLIQDMTALQYFLPCSSTFVDEMLVFVGVWKPSYCDHRDCWKSSGTPDIHVIRHESSRTTCADCIQT